jgi:hypothetical protein
VLIVTQIRYVTIMSNVLTSFVCFVCFILWAVVGLYHILDGIKGRAHMDLMVYVCGEEIQPLAVRGLVNARIMCGELRYAWWAVLSMILVEAIVFVTVGWAFCAGRRKGVYIRVG